MEKKPAQAKKQKLLTEFRLSGVSSREPSIEQIGQMLIAALTRESRNQETPDKDKKAKQHKAARLKANAGKILIICDTPIPENLIPWLTAKRYVYTVVKSEEEANARLDYERFDCIVYSHEFY